MDPETGSRAVTLIILAWNQWPSTRETLDTLRKTRLDHARVIVVDNGSVDETPRALAGYKEWVKVIRLEENLGFVRGNNVGIEAADPDSDIVLLNNDLIFNQKDWLQRLRECAGADPARGVVGCRLVLPDGRLIHTGSYILPDTCWGQQNESGAPEKDIGQFRGTRKVQGIVFAVAYIRREVIRAIGGLSERYRTYFEDTDYCLRALQAGFDTYLCGDVTIIHDEHGSTSANDVIRRKLFEEGRCVFKKHWKRYLEDRYVRNLHWQSIMNFPTGYAMSCRAFLRELDQAGVRVTYHYVYGKGTPFPVEEPEDAGDYRMNVIRARNGSVQDIPIVVYGQGDVFCRAQGRKKVGFTMLEVDGFPREWVRQANGMDEVWVPSEFNRKAFIECGLKRPVHIIPLGVNTDYFHPEINRFPNPSGEFVFLACFEWGERKEPWLLLKTFNAVFKAGEPVRLLAKINNRDPSIDLGREIRNLGLSDAGGRISYLINIEFPYYQLGSLYRSADCLVSAGRGEGWDMPLMEAMACGLPTIATDWGAHTDFVHPDICYPLRIRGTIPAVAKCPYYDGFSWADPDPEHLAFLLRRVYENREEAQVKGAAAAVEMANRWRWRDAARKIMERIDR
ncbi:MAG: glycosyltransferase, partial [Pseudomonadota bacterium]